MNTWTWVAIGAGVLVVGGGAYLLLKPSPPPTPLGTTTPPLSSAVDDGARERSALYGFLGSIVDASSRIYTTERARADSGRSTSPSYSGYTAYPADYVGPKTYDT